MFDIFRNENIPDDALIPVSQPIVDEVKSILGNVTSVEFAYRIYKNLFLQGYITGYIYGAAEVLGEKACDDYNVKKGFIYRWVNKVRVYKCVIQEVFGDTEHAQESRNILPTSPPERQALELFGNGYTHGIDDGKHYLSSGGFKHYLKSALYQHSHDDESLATLPTHSLIDVLKIRPIG